MSGPIPLIPGGYPPEFVDALSVVGDHILAFLAESLPDDARTNKEVVDIMTEHLMRGIGLAFMMGAQWQSEHPHMPIDRKPR
jgi:hypothetical protein